MKAVFICLGFLFFALGAVGAFLPVLPTVPFLLLASFCFMRGSRRYYNWFVGTRLYRRYLKDYVRTKSMPLRAKLIIVIPVSAMLLALMILVDNLPMRIVLGVVLVAKHLCFWKYIKTSPPRPRVTSDVKAQ